MEIRIVIFLAFVSVTLITNTLLIIFAYKLFAGMTQKVTGAMAELRQTSEVREWIQSFEVASEHAASVTEATRQKAIDFDGVLARAEEGHRRLLESVDERLEKTADNIEKTAQTMRDIVAKPAFSVAAFAAGVASIVQDR